MRGLKAWAALPPSENHLQGDFKNIPVMLQDKSLISGNYVPPTLPPFTSHSLLLSSRSTGGAAMRAGTREGGEEMGLLPGSRQWSWPLMLYCTSIHVEWLTCGQQLPTKWSKLSPVMKWLDWLNDWLHRSSLLVCVNCPICNKTVQSCSVQCVFLYTPLIHNYL